MTDAADRIARLRKWATWSGLYIDRADVLALCDDYEALAAEKIAGDEATADLIDQLMDRCETLIRLAEMP